MLLSIASVRHLFPDIEIRILQQYVRHDAEYDGMNGELERLGVEKIYHTRKRHDPNGRPKGSWSNRNGLYFTEGLNGMMERAGDVEDKLVMLDEDHFFTTGETLRFLDGADFDLATGQWPAPPSAKNRPSREVNGSIIAVDTRSMGEFFPLPERAEYIEILLGRELHDRAVGKKLKVIDIPTRNYTNFGGDGFHSNDTDEIRRGLQKAGIL